jgi:hypothetical protein
LESFISNVVGKKYTLSVTGTNEILGNFNSCCENNLLTFINEGKQDGGSILDKEVLKSRITDIPMAITKKGKDARMGENWSKYMLFTNNKNAVTLSASDRRTVLINCGCSKVGDTAYFSNLQSIMRIEMYGHYFNWLSQRDLSKFDAKAIPETKMREDLKIDSLSSSLEHIRQICEDKRPLSLKKGLNVVYSMSDLYNDYREFCRETGIKDRYAVIQKRYKERLTEDLNIKYGKFTIDDGRVTGFDLNYDQIDEAFQKHLKISKSIFEVD